MKSSENLWQTICRDISEASGADFALAGEQAVGGGCINEAVTLSGRDGRRFFVKLNAASGEAMFAAEAEGLDELARANAIRVPAPLCRGVAAGRAYLVLEQLELGGRAGGSSGSATRVLGEQLAGLHRYSAERFGWHRDNTIGATPQINTPDADWVAFWRAHRLGFQLELAARNGYRGKLLDKGERLLADMEPLFSDVTVLPSLLHGDLWSGNYAVLHTGEPVIFDPAVYYGDREADLAMTELFGGFPADFYAAYRQTWPLDPGYAVRKTFYNLYHILNHLNLFGGGYAAQAERMTDQILSELR